MWISLQGFQWLRHAVMFESGWTCWFCNFWPLASKFNFISLDANNYSLETQFKVTKCFFPIQGGGHGIPHLVASVSFQHSKMEWCHWRKWEKPNPRCFLKRWVPWTRKRNAFLVLESFPSLTSPLFPSTRHPILLITYFDISPNCVGLDMWWYITNEST